MYRKYFGLSEMPFTIAPNPHYLYLSQRHQEALAHLFYGIQGEGGVVLLTGEVGTGKTTLSRRLLKHGLKNIDFAWIINPKLSVTGLLATICDELGIDYQTQQTSIKDFTDLISAHLIKNHAQGRNTVVMIDEAQNLSAEVLEQLRLLTNLETDRRKLLQIALLGQTELKTMLARHDLRQFSQRITARYHLGPLSRLETGAYINHRLAVAGCNRPIFTPHTCNLIHHASQGIPRLINLICSRAMLGIYAHGESTARVRHIRQAMHEVLGEPASPLHRIITPVTMTAAGAAMFVLAIVISIPELNQWKNHLQRENQIAVKYENIAKTPAAVIPPIVEPLVQAETLAQAEAAAATPEPQPVVTDPWGEIDHQGSKTQAFQTLTEIWKIPLQVSKQGDACTQILAHGLRCLHKRGGIKSLLKLNRPAVIPLVSSEGDFAYFGISNISSDTATLQLGEQQWTLSLDELEKYWQGDFTILWQPPPGYRGLIRLGSQGKPVIWLSRQLDRLQGELIPPQTFRSMNQFLADRLRDFQRRAELHPDGVAGALTIIHLNGAAGIKGPRLIGRKHS